MRGLRSNYLSLIDEETVNNEKKDVNTDKRRGRSQDLFTKQTEFIMHRHYYYLKILGKPYLASIELLESESYVAKRTILNRLQTSHARMVEIFKGKPTLKDLKTKYPHVNWVN